MPGFCSSTSFDIVPPKKELPFINTTTNNDDDDDDEDNNDNDNSNRRGLSTNRNWTFCGIGFIV